MKSITIKNITKFHQEGKAKKAVLKNISLTIPSGQFFALLGPSGCGKTTLLRLIAGFESVDSGSLYLGNQEITHFPVNKRRINIVFQNYALFPHLNLFHNVAYSLMIKKYSDREIKEKVLAILETFQLENDLEKFPKELSGGQQQRVALARAIINQPDVLLLDEPLSALDFKLREKVLIELIDLQDQLGMTFIYVTHDQFEALTVADQMAIMGPNGHIEQIGTPKEIYEFPISTFVAKFVGTTNLLVGRLNMVEKETFVDVETLGKFSIFITQKKEWMVENCLISMSIRPEKILITKSIQTGFSNQLKGIVTQIIYYGRSTQYVVMINKQYKLTVFEQNEEHFLQEEIDYDEEVYLYWQKENAILLKE